MIDKEALSQAAQTLVSDQQLADYFDVDIEVIRAPEMYRIVQHARAKTHVFVRNKLLALAQKDNKEALEQLSRQLY